MAFRYTRQMSRVHFFISPDNVFEYVMFYAITAIKFLSQ